MSDWDWVEDLDAQNFLAVCDVLLDIEQELNILADEVSIPVVPDVIRFQQLFPTDGVNFRDNYANMRWKASQFLMKKGIFKDVDVQQGAHRWESRFLITADEGLTREALERIRAEYQRRTEEGGEVGVGDSTADPTRRVEKVLSSFHRVAVQLRKRRDNRPTLDVNDEYDVQDLLHALLLVEFEDVRPEEWTPSYAGKSSRVDFFLKSHGLVIEVKKTRQNLTEKQLGDQLIVDIERYRKMPGCETLICFVYDPEDRISNPVGFETDLSRDDEDLKVQTLVMPRRH